MKKIKIKKCMTSFLMLAVMVASIIGVMPKNIVHAGINKDDFDGNSLSATTSVKDDFTDGTGKHINVEYVIKGSDDVFLIIVDNVYRLISKESFTVERIATTDDDSPYSDRFETVSSGNCKHYDYYCADIQISNNQTLRTGYSTTYDKMKSLADSNPTKYDSIPNHFLGAFLYDVSIMEIFEEHKEGEPDGSADNPFEDKDIGTIILKSHAFIPVKNNVAYPSLPQTDDSTFAYYRFKYEDKTSSGFSISNNKYARTFIQVKVQNQCVLLDPNDRNVIKEFYKHYGEFYQYKNIPTENISDNIFKVSWDDITLKWSDFMEHPNSTNKKLAYRFMIRVICTDSLTVIPDENSGWHAGGWRSIVFDGSNFVEETNGHITNDGKWTDDKDDGHNNSSDKTTDVPKTEDEANDSMNDNSSNSSTNFVDKLKQAKNAFDTANEYIKQVLKVPTMLGKLFSFFPDWVLYPFEFAFALIPWIIIYKLLRG